MGSKRHVLTDANGIPLAVCLTAANRHDSMMLEEVVDAVPPIQQSWGRARQGRAMLGRHRWVVERALAWFGQFRRLAICYERRADIHAAFFTLASTIIAWRFVQRWFC